MQKYDADNPGSRGWSKARQACGRDAWEARHEVAPTARAYEPEVLAVETSAVRP